MHIGYMNELQAALVATETYHDIVVYQMATVILLQTREWPGVSAKKIIYSSSMHLSSLLHGTTGMRGMKLQIVKKDNNFFSLLLSTATEPASRTASVRAAHSHQGTCGNKMQRISIIYYL